MMSKRYQKLPVHIVEYHNEALGHIYKAIGSKHLPFDGIGLLHFDAHPDMIIPDITAEDVFNKQTLFDCLSIENWITPALYAGHFDCVVWMKAEWARQISDGEYHFKIGRHRDDGKVRVSFPDDYFLSECLYCGENELENAKNVKFLVKTCQETTEQDELKKIREVTMNKPYILDIDLDFFSTKNPIKVLIGDEIYGRLKRVYEFKPPKSRAQNEINECGKSRGKDLIAFKTILEQIEKGDTDQCDEHQMFNELKNIYESSVEKLGEEIDAALLHEFGCTTDDPELPHHISGDAEISSLLFSLEKYVTSLDTPPTLVTISRSSIDDYCPSNQVDQIQNRVVESLHKIFENVEVFNHYKDK